jgi:hypothetical protein
MSNIYRLEMKANFFMSDENIKKWNKFQSIENFEKFSLYLLQPKDLIKFFKDCNHITVSETVIENQGKPIPQGSGWVGEKVVNKVA